MFFFVFSADWTMVLCFSQLHLFKFMLFNTITCCMDPLITLIATYKAFITIFRWCFEADTTKVTIGKEDMTLSTQPFLALWMVAFTPFVPFSLLILCYWIQFFQATQTLDTVVAVPAFWWDCFQRWVKTVDMYCNVTHFTDYDVFFLVC